MRLFLPLAELQICVPLLCIIMNNPPMSRKKLKKSALQMPKNRGKVSKLRSAAPASQESLCCGSLRPARPIDSPCISWGFWGKYRCFRIVRASATQNEASVSYPVLNSPTGPGVHGHKRGRSGESTGHKRKSQNPGVQQWDSRLSYPIVFSSSLCPTQVRTSGHKEAPACCSATTDPRYRDNPVAGRF